MIKNKFSRILISTVLTATLVLSGTSIAFGCTGIYFGKDVTENGSTLAGRSEDFTWDNTIKNYTVREAGTHEEGEMYVGASGLTIPYPAKTFRYTMVKDYTGEGEEEMAQVGTNEKGVAVSASVTLSKWLTEVTKVDPTVSGGLGEEDIPSVVLMQAETARQGAQILIDIYEKIGASGRDMTMISDKTETWIVQSLSGHNAVAVKAPSDMVGFTPNMTANVDLSDENNTITTENLVATAEKAGTLKKDDKGMILIADSYAIKPTSVAKRLWQGYNYLRDSEYADSTTAGYINLFIEPRAEKNYTVYEALRLLAYRGEGTTHYGGTGTGNGDGIGNDNNLETHVFETRHNMPAEMAVLQWLSLTPPEFGVYIPGYNALITDTIPENSIGLDTMEYNYENPDANSYRTTFFELYFLCKGRDSVGPAPNTLEARTKYGSGVQQFWEKYQKSLIEQQKEIDKDMKKILAYDYDLALEKATALNMHLQKEALRYAKEMITELNAYMADNQGEEVFIPTALKEGKLPTYSFSAIGGTGLPKPPVAPPAPVPEKPEITVPENMGTTVELSKDGTTATITVEEGYEIADVILNGVSLGKVTEIKNLKTGDKVEIVVEKIETDAEKAERIIKGVKGTTIKACSEAGKGYVRVKWTKSKGYKVDYYEVYRAKTKTALKDSKKPFFETKSGTWKSYKNTKDLKKGNRYYYRVRGVREINGNVYYTNYSTIAYRTVK